MTSEYGLREREGFMAGWSRMITWEEYSGDRHDWYCTRADFMRGYSRQLPWKGNTGG